MKITTRSWINLTVTSTLLNLLFVVEQVYSNDDLLETIRYCDISWNCIPCSDRLSEKRFDCKNVVECMEECIDFSSSPNVDFCTTTIMNASNMRTLLMSVMLMYILPSNIVCWNTSSSANMKISLKPFQGSGKLVEIQNDKNGCPGYVGYEGKLKSEAGVRFSIMIDNSFKCSGEVVAWQYYRCTAQDSIYVTTWTPSVDDARVFTLKTITELPPAPLGKYTTVKLDAPLQVEKDDVIGLAYKMGTKNGGLTWEQEKDDVNDRILDTNEYYKTHSSTKVFLDTVTIGDDVNVKTQLSKRPSLMNFSIRAVMSYGRSWRLNCGKVYNNEIIGPNKNELQMRKLEEYGDNWIMSFGTPKLSEYKTTKLISCIAKCIAKPECMSINFNKQYMGGQCNLYQLHKPRAPIHLYRATDKGWTMYSCIPK